MVVTVAADPGGGCHQAAHQNHRQRQAPAQLAQQLAHGLQQPLGDAGDLQHRPHEHEGGNRQQREVAHDSEDPRLQRAEKARIDHAAGDAQQAKDHGHTAEAKGDGIAAEQRRNQRQEHQWCQHLTGEKGDAPAGNFQLKSH